ncbi:hypothetical protein CGH51_25140, partial [Vibrio parahaemolyticus]|uniref:serine protease n=1 Tax=Vibrio parahaemolyticus TaxID=670 RepID=UPI001173E15C
MNKQLVEKASCKIYCDGEKGSGFFVTNDKIITCRHVIARHILINDREIKIKVGGSSTEYTAQLVDDCKET